MIIQRERKQFHSLATALRYYTVRTLRNHSVPYKINRQVRTTTRSTQTVEAQFLDTFSYDYDNNPAKISTNNIISFIDNIPNSETIGITNDKPVNLDIYWRSHFLAMIKQEEDNTVNLHITHYE